MPNSEPVMKSIIGINMAKKNAKVTDNINDQTFLFIQYEDLIAQPAETIQRIYDFCGWAPYPHDFQNIINIHPENDEFYKLAGFHTIRPTLQKAENNVVLPPDIQAKCLQIDTLMGYI